MLVADSDSDDDGEALADEFSDTIAAYPLGKPGYRVRIHPVSMTTVHRRIQAADGQRYFIT